MKLDTIGKNIRKFRLVKKLRQEDLAEKTGLTANYIGMNEKLEKLAPEDRNRIYEVIDTLVKQSKQIIP